MVYYAMSQEEIIKALTELGYPLENLRQYPWFERAESNPDLYMLESLSPMNRLLDKRMNVYSYGENIGGQEYLFPGVATPQEMYGDSVFNSSDYLEYVPNEVVSQKLMMGDNWGIPVESPEQSDLLGGLISQYMSSLIK